MARFLLWGLVGSGSCLSPRCEKGASPQESPHFPGLLCAGEGGVDSTVSRASEIFTHSLFQQSGRMCRRLSESFGGILRFHKRVCSETFNVYFSMMSICISLQRTYNTVRMLMRKIELVKAFIFSSIIMPFFCLRSSDWCCVAYVC